MGDRGNRPLRDVPGLWWPPVLIGKYFRAKGDHDRHKHPLGHNQLNARNTDLAHHLSSKSWKRGVALFEHAADVKAKAKKEA
jgi:hypothetical protein